jgi:hypothetical protein
LSRRWASAGGLVASTAVKGSRITYVCEAPSGTVQESPAANLAELAAQQLLHDARRRRVCLLGPRQLDLQLVYP